MNLIDSPAWRAGSQKSPNSGCMILLKSTRRNIVFRDPPHRFISRHQERVDFGKWRNVLAAFQGNSAGVRDLSVNDHHIGTGRAYIFNSAYRMKVIPTNHLEALGPETLF